MQMTPAEEAALPPWGSVIPLQQLQAELVKVDGAGAYLIGPNCQFVHDPIDGYHKALIATGTDLYISSERETCGDPTLAALPYCQ